MLSVPEKMFSTIYEHFVKISLTFEFDFLSKNVFVTLFMKSFKAEVNFIFLSSTPGWALGNDEVLNL